jgi:AcrR family transcriptional regulator
METISTCQSEAPVTSKPLRADAQRNRDALIAKAREIFAQGDADLRFDDFARLAGVGTGTLYRHFPTREALAEAVFRGEVTALCARAEELRVSRPAEEALATFLREFAGFLRGHHGLARTLASLLATRAGALAEGGEALTRAIDGLLTDAVRAGAVRDDVGIGSVMMILHGISAAHDHPGGADDADGAITLVLDGLRRPDPAPPRPE